MMLNDLRTTLMVLVLVGLPVSLNAAEQPASSLGEIDISQWVSGEGVEKTKTTLTVTPKDDSRVGDLLHGLTQPLVLDPGVYKIQADVSAELARTVGYRLVLTVRDAEGKLIHDGYRQPRDRMTPRPKERWLAQAEAYPVQQGQNGRVTLTAILPVTEPFACQVAVGWSAGNYNFGRHLKSSEAPSPLDRMTLHSLRIERRDTPVAITQLAADKVVYKGGGAPVLTATIAMVEPAAREFAYRVRVQKDLDPPGELTRGTITLKPGQTQTFQIALPELTVFGGYRCDLELLDGDRVVATAERSLAVSDLYNRIGIGGVPAGETVTSTWNINRAWADRALANMRNAYIGWMEIGFWAPDDFSNLTPDREEFISNVMSPQRTSHIHHTIEAAHRNGVGIYTYLKGNYVDGRDGFLFAQKHPELIYYHRDTGRPIGQWDMEHLIHWDEHEKQKLAGESKLGQKWYYLRLDVGRPSVVDVSARETIASINMFGWDGVRFDGDFEVPVSDLYFEGPVRNMHGEITATAEDAEVTYANAVLRYKRKIRQAYPEFEFGFNHALDDSQQRWIAGPAIASMGSMVMNEPARGFAHGPERAYNRWADYAAFLAKYSRIIRSWGGFMQPIGAYGMRPDDYLYQSVFTLAAQAKPFGPYLFTTPYEVRLSRFVTRFAGILCSDLHPIPAPEGRIHVKASGELWWKRYANYRDVSLSRRDYVLSFINPPVSERARNIDDARCLLREPVTVEVTLALDSLETPVKAYLLDPWNPADYTEVAINQSSDVVTMKLPRPISVWSVLVLQCDLKEAQ